MKSWIVETDDKIFIDHIPRLEWGKSTENSFIRSTQLTLNALGDNYSYEYLMGISGAAFRLHFHPDWCPSSADATVGFDVSKVLFNALGFTCNLLAINDNNFSEIRDLFKKIIKQIDQGIPVLAINLKTCPEWGVITGYLKNRPGIICRTYFDDSDEYSLAERAPWLSFFIKKIGEPKNNKSLFIDSLKTAVELAETDYYEKYASGYNAFDLWINRLRQISRIKSAKRTKEITEMNLVIFNILLDARKSLLKYLATINLDLGLMHGESILDRYAQEVSMLRETFEHVFSSSTYGPEKLTQDQINALIKALSYAYEIEKDAIELIKVSYSNQM